MDVGPLVREGRRSDESVKLGGKLSPSEKATKSLGGDVDNSTKRTRTNVLSDT